MIRLSVVLLCVLLSGCQTDTPRGWSVADPARVQAVTQAALVALKTDPLLLAVARVAGHQYAQLRSSGIDTDANALSAVASACELYKRLTGDKLIPTLRPIIEPQCYGLNLSDAEVAVGFLRAGIIHSRDPT